MKPVRPHTLKPVQQETARPKWQLSDSRSIGFMNDRRAFLYVTLSVLIMAHGSLVGPLGILVFYGMWLPKIQVKGVPTLKINRYNALPFIFMFWCLLSVMWSSYPKTSLYKALEYSSLVLCTLIISEVVRVRVYLRALAMGSTITLLIALLSRKYAIDYFTGTYSLVGYLGSKNQVGLFASILVVTSIVTLPIVKGSFNKLATCVVPMILGFYCVYASRSATSTIALAATLGVLGGMLIITWLPRGMRGFSFMFVLLWAIALVVMGGLLGWQEDVLHFFGKSSTLTGRTELWAKGLEYSQGQMLQGGGYAGFWVPGYMPAEHLWMKFGILSKRGFHFHNLYVQALADLGIVGASLLGMMILQTLRRAMKLALMKNMQATHIAAVAFAFMYFVRSLAEVDLLGTFAVGPLVFYAIMQMVSPRAEQTLQPEPTKTPHNS